MKYGDLKRAQLFRFTDYSADPKEHTFMKCGDNTSIESVSLDDARIYSFHFNLEVEIVKATLALIIKSF